MTAAPQVVDVEQEATTTTAPQLQASLHYVHPKCRFLGDWHDVKDYLIDNLVKSHMYYYDYKEASKHSGCLLQYLQRVATTSCYNRRE